MNPRLPFLAIAAFLIQSSAIASPGPYDDFIKQVQQTLVEAGFDAGPINGDFGFQTQAALAQFQLSQLLPASGALDDKTLEALDVKRPAEQ